MLDKIPFTRLKYFLDFSALNRRMSAPIRTQNHFAKPKQKGEPKKNPTYLPKYSRYLFRNSNLVEFPETKDGAYPSLRVYPKQICMFAIQDSFSRFIVHACMKEAPTSDFIVHPKWFRVDGCFTQTFAQYGSPFEVVLDGWIWKLYHRLLEQRCVQLAVNNHPAYHASLERFFQSVQYEMRKELTQKNLQDYVNFYNFERPHEGLSGFTPACAWLTGSKERFETFAKNAENEDRTRLFSEVAVLVKSNYVQR